MGVLASALKKDALDASCHAQARQGGMHERVARFCVTALDKASVKSRME